MPMPLPDTIILIAMIVLSIWVISRIAHFAKLDDPDQMRAQMPTLLRLVGAWEIGMGITLISLNGWSGVGTGIVLGTLGGFLLLWAKFQQLLNQRPERL